MKNINELMERLHLDEMLTSENIPELELYMDQVIKLFDNQFVNTKRTPEDKIITKTMINNYSKGKLFFPVKNKKYTREHVMLIHMIYEMKTVLSIRDIKQSVNELNHAVTTDQFNLEQFYNKYTEMMKQNVNYFYKEGNEISESVWKKVQDLSIEDKEYVNQLLLILSFVNKSNNYRRAAELMVDELAKSSLNQD